MDDQELKKALVDMAKAQKKSASLWLTFWRGVLYGLGFFIGSAILATVVIYILSKLEGWGTIGNFIHNIVDNASKSKS
ncbi:MAG: DUF5665 domain-containing protein [Patescibacteria group bacterium]